MQLAAIKLPVKVTKRDFLRVGIRELGLLTGTLNLV